MTHKVVELSEVDTEVLFRTKDYLLGDKGRWFVVDEDGFAYGRYTNKAAAQEHADTLNDPRLTTVEDFVAAMAHALSLEDK